MTSLYIDGKLAVIEEGQTLKLIREDPYFTKSGSYTYNITLPALCPENIAIFGHLYRKELGKKIDTTYKALLCVDNRDILNGTATITSVTEKSIKIQLMGGNSELNFYTKNEHRYLDELDLGTWYQDEGISSDDLTMKSMARKVKSEFESDIELVGVDQAFKVLCRRLWNYNTKEEPCSWVALPCVNDNFDVTCNNFGIKQFWVGDETRYYTCINDLDNVNMSIQPYLVPMIERIFAYLGYPVVANSLRDNDFFMKLVIVTANNRSAIARALPHWTVTEFIEEIENLFAVVVFIDETTKETSIRARADFFKENVEYVDNIVEEFTVTRENENTSDISNANIGYSEVSEYDRLENDIRALGKEDYSFDNEDFTAGLQNLVDHLYYLRRADQSVEKNSLFKYRGTIFKICGRSIIIEFFDYVDTSGGTGTYPNHARTIFVDEFANRINVKDKTDIDIELKICPSKIIDKSSVPFFNSEGVLVGTSDCYHLVKGDNTNPTGIEDETNAYLAGIISGEAEKPETKEDIMSICMYDGGFVKRDFIGDSTQEYFRSFLTQVAYPGTGIQCFYPSGYLMSQWQGNTYTGGGAIQKYSNESLSLNIDSFEQSIGGRKYTYRTFYSEVFKNLKNIDTQVKHCFKFVTDRFMQVNSTFIIRNRKYVCEKLEYQISDKKIEKLVTGYFYELNI